MATEYTAEEKPSAEINIWKPKKSEVMVTTDGNVFIINFDKIYGAPNLAIYNRFVVKKTSFEKHLALGAKYINYFVNKYDTEGKLLWAYLGIKACIDKEKLFDASNPHALIDLIYELIFTPEMCDKIRQLVDDSYLDDIERPVNGSYKPDGKDYLESLEFDNHHIKILLRISFGMKIICPIMFHYFTINKIKPDELKSKKDVSIIYDFYYPLLELFQDDVNIFNKLFVYIKRKVMDSKFHNGKIFGQRDIFGDDDVLLIERFIKKQLISENIVKYKFSEKWDPKYQRYEENIIGLQKTIIRYQLIYFLKETYAKTLTEMTNTRDSEGLSAADKMEMNMSKIDIGFVNMAEINVELTLEELKKNIDIPISEEEIQYYRDNHHPSDVQIQLWRTGYASRFMSYKDLQLIDRHEYNELLLLMKKRLLLNCGYERPGSNCDAVLPYIITGNLEGKVNSRIIRNTNLLKELDDNEIYQYLVNVKYKEFEEYRPGYIKSIISTFISTSFTYVVYEDPELLGKPIICEDEQIAYELLVFLKEV